ncbi:MAG: hypothetical protein RR365_00895 [Bacteroides sp.]
MLKISNGNIIMVRGDTARFSISIYCPDSSKTKYVLKDGDKVVFTVRRLPKKGITDDFIFQKVFVNNQIAIDPYDTATLDYGDYIFDVELTFANGDVNTIIEKHVLTLKEEVS